MRNVWRGLPFYALTTKLGQKRGYFSVYAGLKDCAAWRVLCRNRWFSAETAACETWYTFQAK